MTKTELWQSDAPARGPRGALARDGETIAWESYGDGECVVLTHGLGGSHASFFQQVPVLAPRFRVVTWDQRGFGRSTSASGRLGTEVASHDLEALLDHLDIEQAHLVGQSMGGFTTLAFALRRPERVRSIVLADTPGGIATPRVAEQFRAYVATMAQAPPVERWPLDRHPAIGAALGARDPARAFLYDQIASLSPPPPPAIALELLRTAHAPEAIAAIRAPVLFVVGEHDPIFPPDVIRDAAACVPGARTIVLPGAGHSPYFETPEAWNDAVLAFLDAVSVQGRDRRRTSPAR